MVLERCILTRKDRKEQGKQSKRPGLTSGNNAVGFADSLRREMSEAERKGPHCGCFWVSDSALLSGPCSSGKSNLVNSYSGLEEDPLFSVILDFLFVRL